MGGSSGSSAGLLTGWLTLILTGIFAGTEPDCRVWVQCLVSFLSKIMHQLLPTQERLSRTNPAISGKCKMVGCDEEQKEDLEVEPATETTTVNSDTYEKVMERFVHQMKEMNGCIHLRDHGH